MSTESKPTTVSTMIMPLGTLTRATKTDLFDFDLNRHFLTLLLLIAAVEGQVGKKIWVIMRGEKEFTGTLTGYDEFISTKFFACFGLYVAAWLLTCISCTDLVLSDVTELYVILQVHRH